MRPRCHARSARLLVLLTAIATVSLGQWAAGDVARGCTVVSVARASRVIFAGNDDYVDRDTRLWIDPAGPGHYGALWIGERDNVQQGFNEKGLAYDANGLPSVATNPHRERLPVEGGYTSYPIQILRACATVDEVIAWVRAHQWHERMWDQWHFADSAGDAVVIGAGPDGELVFTRKVHGDGFLASSNFNLANRANGDFPCERFTLATQMLDGIRRADDLSVGRVTAIMDAVHVATPVVWTKVTVVADRVSRTVNVYYFHQFDRPITLRIDEELAGRRPDTALSALFPPETIARADAAHARLLRTRALSRIAAVAWVLVVLGCGRIVWRHMATRGACRFAWTMAALVLGPVGLAAWVASGRGRADDAGASWRHAVSTAARAMPPYVAGSVLGGLGIAVIPAVRRDPAWQLGMMYGLPLVLGWIAWPRHLAAIRGCTSPSPPGGRVLQVITVGHLTLAGVWLAVVLAGNHVAHAVGVGAPSVVLQWTVAVAGAALSGALVSAHLAMVPSPTWRDSWWWVPLSLLVLAFGATFGKALERVLAVVPIIATSAGGA